jgi:hypothetical protein
MAAAKFLCYFLYYFERLFIRREKSKLEKIANLNSGIVATIPNNWIFPRQQQQGQVVAYI